MAQNVPLSDLIQDWKRLETANANVMKRLQTLETIHKEHVENLKDLRRFYDNPYEFKPIFTFIKEERIKLKRVLGFLISEHSALMALFDTANARNSVLSDVYKKTKSPTYFIDEKEELDSKLDPFQLHEGSRFLNCHVNYGFEYDESEEDKEKRLSDLKQTEGYRSLEMCIDATAEKQKQSEESEGERE